MPDLGRRLDYFIEEAFGRSRLIPSGADRAYVMEQAEAELI